MKTLKQDIEALEANDYYVYDFSILSISIFGSFTLGFGLTMGVFISLFWGNVG